jgi:hypothetical protein
MVRSAQQTRLAVKNGNTVHDETTFSRGPDIESGRTPTPRTLETG